MRSFTTIGAQPDEARLKSALAEQLVIAGAWPTRPGTLLPIGPPPPAGQPTPPPTPGFSAWNLGVPFPPNLDTLLARASPSALDPDDNNRAFGSKEDGIARAFSEYFSFDRVKPIAEPGLEALLQNRARPIAGVGGYLDGDAAFPTDWASPAHRVRLAGIRGSTSAIQKTRIDALFSADLVWLFFHERMGLFRMLGVILDDFVTRGQLLLANDDWNAYVIETLVRDTKMGLASRKPDRNSSYLRVLGWKLGTEPMSDVKANTAFNEQFHTLIRVALRFYKERQVNEVVGNKLATINSPSAATVTAVRSAVVELRNAFEAFEYGRNYVHALQGIATVIGGLALLRDLRKELGVPAGLSRPEQYVPLLFDRLFPSEAGSMKQANRYTAHRDCAQAGRDILLDAHFLSEDEPTLRLWLGMMEPTFELYRSSYRCLTGVDLGADELRVIEQAA